MYVWKTGEICYRLPGGYAKQINESALFVNSSGDMQCLINDCDLLLIYNLANAGQKINLSDKKDENREMNWIYLTKTNCQICENVTFAGFLRKNFASIGI